LLFLYLHNKVLSTASNTRYLSFEAVQAPFEFGRDVNDRFLISVNFDVMKEVG